MELQDNKAPGEEFGAYLSVLMRRGRWTNTDLARAAGGEITRQTIARARAGYMMSEQKLAVIAPILGVTVEDLRTAGKARGDPAAERMEAAAEAVDRTPLAETVERIRAELRAVQKTVLRLQGDLELVMGQVEREIGRCMTREEQKNDLRFTRVEVEANQIRRAVAELRASLERGKRQKRSNGP